MSASLLFLTPLLLLLLCDVSYMSAVAGVPSVANTPLLLLASCCCCLSVMFLVCLLLMASLLLLKKPLLLLLVRYDPGMSAVVGVTYVDTPLLLLPSC
jgi:hypothetical protein